MPCGLPFKPHSGLGTFQRHTSYDATRENRLLAWLEPACDDRSALFMRSHPHHQESCMQNQGIFSTDFSMKDPERLSYTPRSLFWANSAPRQLAGGWLKRAGSSFREFQHHVQHPRKSKLAQVLFQSRAASGNYRGQGPGKRQELFS